LNESDLATQKWIIAGTVETDVRGAKTRLETRGAAPVTSDEMGLALAATHQAILDAAFENDSMLDWLTVIPTPDEKLALSPLDITLYNGMAGMALYFAYFAAYTGAPKDAVARDKVICNLKTQVATDWDTFELPGTMNGIGGVAYVYGHLGALLDDDAYFDAAFEVMQRAVMLQQADPGFFDFIGGAAGLITVATGLYETTGQSRYLTQAQALCDILFSAIRHDDRGAYWAATDEERALTGLSHGLAGLAFGLASLYKHRPDPALKDMINHLLQRENQEYVATQKNWLDWRYVNLKQALDDSAHFQHHWCNGSSGIGLSRIGLSSLGWKNEAIHADVTAAAQSTLKGGLRHNHSLCHGDFGNLDFLGQAASYLGDDTLADQVAQGLGESCRDILNGHILGGASRRVTPPDLMTGLSGVAWGLLRQLAPDRVPDLLLLAPAKGLS
jgi:type 2 lantibiotic biosynthesis protein LanM